MDHGVAQLGIQFNQNSTHLIPPGKMAFTDSSTQPLAPPVQQLRKPHVPTPGQYAGDMWLAGGFSSSALLIEFMLLMTTSSTLPKPQTVNALDGRLIAQLYTFHLTFSQDILC
ncbi:hypothetical protein JOB18_045592 [Solea senegalensis]|uniref:Uncharacterized protein n=1 Tax=Solea senegalensis TaxID=28829 RepID=A0AAV6SMF3_SOLSE|nr:hypothetical protein JOB18_045592 [Solea senegalensis]